VGNVAGLVAHRLLVAIPILPVLMVLGPAQAHGETITQTFRYTGEQRTFVVPAGVESVAVVAEGGAGGAATAASGGQAAQVRASLSVTPGERLYVEVGGAGASEQAGGAGGFNGGGNSGPTTRGGGAGGGGASDVRTAARANGLQPDPRLLIAGGGGGAGGPGACGLPGGEGGGAEQNGRRGNCSNGGGTAGTGFAGGTGTEGGDCGTGQQGELGQGGAGSGAGYAGPGSGGQAFCTQSAGGGGGGGLYGGAGGSGGDSAAGGGGGGGSSLVPPGGTLGSSTAEPQIQISYEAASTAQTEPATEITSESATLNGSVDTDGFEAESCNFEYGETSSYGQTVRCNPKIIETEEGETRHVSRPVFGLVAKKTYHFRVALTVDGVTTYGQDTEFETRPPRPVVEAVSPPAGFEEGGNTVTITGRHLSETSSVAIGEAGVGFTINSDGSINATVPPHKEAIVDVIVRGAGGESFRTEHDHYFYVRHGHAPTITSASLRKGPSAGGTEVRIDGTSFNGVTAVKFGDTEASYTVNTSEIVFATAPPGTTGTTEITVTTPNGESGLTSKARYTYGPPTITGLSPTEQPIPAGEQVTITGTGFRPGTAQTAFVFGKTQPTNVNCASTTECTVTAPPAAGAGTVVVRAISGGKKSAVTSADRFTYETPRITNLSETSGSLAGGGEITVHGNGFAHGAGNIIFTFGKIRAIHVNCPTSTECTLLTPAASKAGQVDVTATVGKTTSTTSPADQYRYE
jgi:hypothetical protein